MPQKYTVAISVRNLVEFILCKGDLIGSSQGSASDMAEGTKAHRKLQKQAGKEYLAEVRLKHIQTFAEEDVRQTALSEGLPTTDFEIDLKVDGICDGIFTEDGHTVIDEIKSTAAPLEEITEDTFPLHWAQAKCYAFIYGAENGLSELKVRLTYYQIETKKIKYFYLNATLEELAAFFYGLTEKYKKWAIFDIIHRIQRERGICALQFPYDDYRKGQRELAAACYKTVKSNATLYAQAPTGTGKTASVLFGAAKTLYDKKKTPHGRKIFYLTAKTVTSSVAIKACSAIHERGFEDSDLPLGWKCIALTSKEKLCNYEKQCDPQTCPYAKGHFDRLRDAVFDILRSESIITRTHIEKYAEKYSVCPFEFSLDVADRCDVIIGDYNYAFDPNASLKRYFSTGGDHVLLIDEAHNLIDRGRDMFSCGISKRAVLKAARILKNIPPLAKRLKKINTFLLKLKKETEDDRSVTEPFPEMYSLCLSFCEAYSVYLSEKAKGTENKDAKDLYFNLLNFTYLYTSYDCEYFRSYVEKTKSDIMVKIFCADPSAMLQKVYDKCTAVIFFSATLLPSDYCKTLLGRKNGADGITNEIILTSPFLAENQHLMIANGFSASYKNRESTYPLAADYINAVTEKKKGNYFAFFPSFAYLEKVYAEFGEKFPNIRTLKQDQEMTEEDREGFLSEFKDSPQDTLVAFAVMGGIFSEGIDLVGERLSGAFIVSVGIPQICFERDLIKQIFDSRGGDGYLYSYRYPGFNRVLQAAGRVIRSQTDKGIVVLMDSRFLESGYTSLFPRYWKKLYIAKTPQKAGELTEKFWKS